MTAATPVIEAKKQTISTNVTLDELQNIPSSRDPWVVLQTVPGIIVDRVNVGGAESGQQSNYQAKGAAGTDNTWNMDGVAITDMAALGSSPTYYDFDMFQEMQVTTGGADPANPTPGVQLNFVLRSGTNKWRGSARYYFENNDLQSDNVGSTNEGVLSSYNRTEFYKDYGAEGGGPLMKDKLWVWGAIGRTNPAMEIYTLRGATDGTVARTDPGCQGGAKSYFAAAGTYNISARDCTVLNNLAAKADYAINAAWRANFTYFRGGKDKFGRGASATRPTETTWNQASPTDLTKAEVNYTMSDRTFLTARYGYQRNRFTLEPIGGRETQPYEDPNQVFHGSYLFYATDRPQHNVQLEGMHFRGNSEYKFGFGYRKAIVASQSGFPGGVLNIDGALVGAPGFMVAQLTRDAALDANASYMHAYLGDQISIERMTINLGARWDRQSSSLTGSSVPAHPFGDAISFMGALTSSAASDLVVWNSVTPRVGVTYALTQDRKTILRGSYAMFASQLLATRSGTVSPIPATNTGSGYVYYLANDLNGDRQTTPNELVQFLPPVVGFDPTNPLGGNADAIGDYKVPMTHEIVFGVEHELLRNFGISANFTWRHLTHFNWLQYDGVDASDYTQTSTFSGTDPGIGAFSVPIYSVNPGALPGDLGRDFGERHGYTQRYWGVELAATKRMSDRWMMRVGFSTNDHREYFAGPEAIADPTPLLPQATAPNNSPNKDGGLVVTQTAGSGKGNIYMVLPKYQYTMTAAYTAKWDINLGMNYVFRQGYATPYYQGAAPGSVDDLNANGRNVLLVSDVNGYRLPNVHSFDARINKAITWQRLRANLDLDIFNLFNSNTILARQINRGAGQFDVTREIMNPRILRLGIRVGF